jgi:hypothetical protein
MYDNMADVCNEFAIPSELKTISICPKIFDHDALARNSMYRMASGGIMSPCLACKMNRFMQQLGWMSVQISCQKSLNNEMTHDIILSVTYACYNIDAGCCKVNETTKWKSPKTFTTYESGFWMQYLKEVWE